MDVSGIASVSSASQRQYVSPGGTATASNAATEPIKEQGLPTDAVEISPAARTAVQDQKKAIEATPEYQSALRVLGSQQNKVISHELAHMSQGGRVAGAASYTYVTGPDGRRYIVGGEVPLTIPTTNDKEQQLQDLEKVKSAALAPAEPSSQDLKVAAEASAQIIQLRTEIAAAKKEGQDGASITDSST